MKVPEKPVRVATGTVEVFQCPLCMSRVMATAEVEVRLGDLVLDHASRGSDALVVEATMPAVTRVRRLVVSHDCTAPADAEVVE